MRVVFLFVPTHIKAGSVLRFPLLRQSIIPPRAKFLKQKLEKYRGWRHLKTLKCQTESAEDQSSPHPAALMDCCSVYGFDSVFSSYSNKILVSEGDSRFSNKPNRLVRPAVMA